MIYARAGWYVHTKLEEHKTRRAQLNLGPRAILDRLLVPKKHFMEETRGPSDRHWRLIFKFIQLLRKQFKQSHTFSEVRRNDGLVAPVYTAIEQFIVGRQGPIAAMQTPRTLKPLKVTLL